MQPRTSRAPLIRLSCLALAVALCAGLGTLASADPGKKLSAREQALVELGRRLFFDPTVSRSGERSCASCHDPDHGFSDPDRVSEDDIGTTRRHSQTLLDSHLNPNAHWDGQFESIEELVTARLRPARGRKGKSHGIVLLGLDGLTAPEQEEEPATGDDGPPIEEEEDEQEGGGGGGDDDYDGASSSRGSAERSTGASSDQPAPTAPAAPAAGGATDSGEKAPAKPADAPKKPVEVKKDPDKDKKGDPDKKDPDKKDPAEKRDDKKRERIDLTKLPRVADVVESGGRYDEAFRAAFGSTSVSTARLAKAIAAYCRTIESTTAPFDRYLDGDASALSPAAKRGLALFRGRGRCATCHKIDGKRPTLTDFEFHNTGVAFEDVPATKESVRRAFSEKIDDATDAAKIDAFKRDKTRVDLGRGRLTSKRADHAAFKTPTLRDVTRRGPYMHNGKFESLAAVVRYYASGGSNDPHRSEHVTGFDASDDDVRDLVAFLGSLTGEQRPGLARAGWKSHAHETKLRFVDDRKRPLAGLTVRLIAVGDVLPAEIGRKDGIVERVTDERGRITFMPYARTHTRLVLPAGLTASSGGLVPDTCRKADIVVPVSGHVEMVVLFREGQAVPRELAAEHLGALVLPGHAAPRTRFMRQHTMKLADGVGVRYRAWLRTDVPPEVKILVPGAKAARASLRSGEVVRLDLR